MSDLANLGAEAKIKYLDGDFIIEVPGTHVFLRRDRQADFDGDVALLECRFSGTLYRCCRLASGRAAKTSQHMIPTLFLTGLLSLTPLEPEGFPEKLVESAAGHFKPGGMVALQLKPGVSVKVDDRPVTTDKGLAVFGYGRDAGKETTLKFSMDGQGLCSYPSVGKKEITIFNMLRVWRRNMFHRQRLC